LGAAPSTSGGADDVGHHKERDDDADDDRDHGNVGRREEHEAILARRPNA
jgi:hypothetical protein